MWKPSTVEDIRKWFAGEYVPNPTAEEFRKMEIARLRALTPIRCMVPPTHPSRR